VIALIVIALFWLGIALFLLLAPDDVFKSAKPRARRYGAAGATIFALFCVVAVVVS
jgi:hypothetical protein